jgi:5-methylthioadenosine/S-adenosylhomocysteine deaminase
MDLCVRNGYVLADGTVREADVGVRDGDVAALGDVGSADREIDASGCVVMPGLINAHTHASMTLLRGYADDLPLEEWLEERIWPVEAQLEPDDIAAGARLAALEMIRTGTTAFADMYFAMDEVAGVVEESGLRGVLGYGIITADKGEDAAREELDRGVAFAREYDGAAEGRVRTMLTPHAPYTCDDETLAEAAERARELGVPLHTHLNETAAEVDEYVAETGQRPAHHLDELGCWRGRAYVAHGVHLDEAERARLAERDVGVAHCPSANMKLASGAAPVADLLAEGATVCLGTDGAASNNTLDMFSEMRHAALLAKLRESDASALPAERVLSMATRDGARALGFPTGAVEPGRPADLAIVDLDAPHLAPRHDLVSHLVYAATGADVTTTIVDGKVLMAEGDVKTLDEAAVIADAQAAAERVVARVEE